MVSTHLAGSIEFWVGSPVVSSHSLALKDLRLAALRQLVLVVPQAGQRVAPLLHVLAQLLHILQAGELKG